SSIHVRRLFQLVRVMSACPGGILIGSCSPARCHNRLSFELPGRITRPLLPPRISFSNVSSEKLDRGVSPLWHRTHRLTMNGAMSFEKETVSLPVALTICTGGSLGLALALSVIEA